MVQWKGEVDREDAGAKAARLDSVDSLKVPNFFVLTRDEIGELLNGAGTPEEVMEAEFPENVVKRLEEAYSEVGMSSEVRGASSEARELVGGQRDSPRVSVRVSGERKGVFTSRLNVGASSLVEAIKQVAASYYRVDTERDRPAVIVQKMVEPGYTGAAVTGYLGNHSLIELVQGLGTPLEDGVTKPELYLLEAGKLEDVKVPETQVAASRNAMSGDRQRERVSRKSPALEPGEAEDFVARLEAEGMDAKFVYSRGSFKVVDAFKPGNTDPFQSTDAGLEGVRVSEGEIEGTVGEEVAFSSDTLPPDSYGDAVIASKGGYTSTDAQLARTSGKPAVFSFDRDLEEGRQVSIGPREVTPGDREQESREEFNREQDAGPASEVLPVNAGNPGIYLSQSFAGRGYSVTDNPVAETDIPASGHLASYGDVFAFEGEKAVLDARKLPERGLEQAIEYLEADLKIIVLNRPDPDTVFAAVENGFEVFGTRESRLKEMEKVVERQERRFILEKLREN